MQCNHPEDLLDSAATIDRLHVLVDSDRRFALGPRTEDGMRVGALLLAFLPLVGAPPQPVPRLVFSLQKAAPGKFSIDVENISPQPLVLAGRAYLVLLDAPGDRPQAPQYWADLKVAGLPTSSSPMQMTGRQRLRLSLDPGSAVWSEDRSGFSADHPLARAVPPGEYELQVQIVDEREAWWRSNGVTVKVSRGGGLAY